MRSLFLAGALSFLVLFGALTVYVIAANGIDAAAVLALIIIAMLAIGVAGAARNPPQD